MKLATMILSISIVIFIVYMIYSYLYFSGGLDKKYTRKELTNNFNGHEKEFEDLESYFFLKTTNVKDYSVTVGKRSKNEIDLSLVPLVINPVNRIIGGKNIKLGSPALDSTLTVLGWTNETIFALEDKLSKSNCDIISTTSSYGRPIDVHPAQSGWSSYKYLIFQEPVTDSIIKIYGNPINDSEFGRRVELVFTSRW